MRWHRFFHLTLINCLPFICFHKKDRLFPYGVWRWIKEIVPARGHVDWSARSNFTTNGDQPCSLVKCGYLQFWAIEGKEEPLHCSMSRVCSHSPEIKVCLNSKYTWVFSDGSSSHALRSHLNIQTFCKGKLHLWQISTLKNQTPGLSIPPCAELPSGYYPANGWQVHFSRISAFGV